MHSHFNFYCGRHSGGRGFARFGQGFMDGGLGGRGFGMGRKLASVDLQLLILGLLAAKPSHGYEIIKALDERSKGFYVPSPGMVYPALTYLEELGQSTVETDGNRKRYHITAAGRDHLEAHRSRVDALFAQFERVGERMDRVRRALHAGSADEAAPQPPAAAMRHAWHDLQRALADKRHSPREELDRIVGILERAAAAIRGNLPSG